MLEAVALALLILVLRSIDVSLATIKTIFIVEGRNMLAPSLGFIEATVYVVAATIVFQDLGNPIKILGFGVGFALGTANGMYWAQRLGLGNITVRFIRPGSANDLIDALRGAGFRLTEMQGAGRDGPVSMVELNLRKRSVAQALAVAKPWLSSSFVTVGDEPLVQPSASAVMDAMRGLSRAPWAGLLRRPHA
ncbi:MAG TPA: DUF5698 domain-containing protein [Dehalococcoidia bacterium]|jgi:uncharacterized protein YebE (UPF0316 family)|nr:DUF5698 domain-containing protein [Dehalococcoidia bacterium]